MAAGAVLLMGATLLASLARPWLPEQGLSGLSLAAAATIALGGSAVFFAAFGMVVAGVVTTIAECISVLREP